MAQPGAGQAHPVVAREVAGHASVHALDKETALGEVEGAHVLLAGCAATKKRGGGTESKQQVDTNSRYTSFTPHPVSYFGTTHARVQMQIRRGVQNTRIKETCQNWIPRPPSGTENKSNGIEKQGKRRTVSDGGSLEPVLSVRAIHQHRAQSRIRLHSSILLEAGPDPPPPSPAPNHSSIALFYT